MKIKMLSFLFLLSTSLTAQQIPGTENSSEFTGGLGLTYVDGKPYYLITAQPELSFGDWGVGLDLNLRFGTDGSLRKQDWDEGYDILRLFRYVRYGQKRSWLYARVGSLDAARLGHGLLMYRFNNSASYDNRKVGLEFDMRFEKWGFETVTSNLLGLEIYGLRGYYNPLKETGIPILSDLEVGATYLTDLNKDGRKLPKGNSPLIYVNNYEETNPVTAVSADIGLPLLDNALIDLTVYSEFGKFIGYGSGGSFGIESNLKGLSTFFSVFARLEHRINGDKFLSNYFGPFYEIERVRQLPDSTLSTKLQALDNTSSSGNGLYGELGATILGTLKISGNYEEMYNIPGSGALHLSTDAGDLIPKVVAKADYYKQNLNAGASIFKLDERSLATAEVGYKPYSFMSVTMYYQWTFQPIKDGDEVVGYETVSRIEPKVNFHFSF